MFDFDTEVWTADIALPAPNILCHDFVRMSGNRYLARFMLRSF